jgi:hypothetical protein
VRTLLVLCALAVPAATGAAPIPTPIGVGPRFHPSATHDAVRAGRALGRLRCTTGDRRFGVHLELFALGRVVIVPAGIGVARPSVRRGASVHPRGCTYPVRTLEPTGVLEVRAGARLTLADAFRIWGQPLSRRLLAGFSTRAAAPVRAYVDGRRRHGAPGAIPLRRHAQIVLELGSYIPPHPAFAFKRGL